jgi:hypothetical protein
MLSTFRLAAITLNTLQILVHLHKLSRCKFQFGVTYLRTLEVLGQISESA